MPRGIPPCIDADYVVYQVAPGCTGQIIVSFTGPDSDPVCGKVLIMDEAGVIFQTFKKPPPLVGPQPQPTPIMPAGTIRRIKCVDMSGAPVIPTPLITPYAWQTVTGKGDAVTIVLSDTPI